MISLEDKGGRPDRNQPDPRVRVGSICLLYGFDPKNPLTGQLNGRQCYVICRSKTGADKLPYPADSLWFQCNIRGIPVPIDIPIEHLMLLDDSDQLVIEKMS